jgi:CheY-like chemotaxis protein
MSHRHALIIEDELLIALELEYLLKEQGFTSIDIADSPQAALDSARQRPPELITADFRILCGTGVEAVAAIEAELGPLPVVFVTSSAALVELAGDRRVVVDKPFSRRELAQACAAVRLAA